MPVSRKKKKLRSGFTTGACAAAAAKTATLLLLGRENGQVEIPFPGGDRHTFISSKRILQDGQASASVIKDAGDDPDVTNGAEITALVSMLPDTHGRERIHLAGGPGVGTVTKPGLPVEVGEAAINPVPQEMIRQAVGEAVDEAGVVLSSPLQVTIGVVDGELLAEKTLNARLGIMGGLSILGTTGIVRPVSARAWTDTIEASMKVARAVGLQEVILSTGRTSEAAVQQRLQMPEEAQVMMGDYLAYALKAAARQGFSRIYLSGMWAKVLKCALGIPQTHVRHGALEVQHAADLLKKLGLAAQEANALAGCNTAREIYQRLRSAGRFDLIEAVCLQARQYAEKRSGLPVEVFLVTSEDGVVAHV